MVHSSASDGCGASIAQSIVRPSSRGGVPVLSRRIGRLDRASFADPAAFVLFLAAEDAAAEKCAGCQYHRPAIDLAAVVEPDPSHLARAQDERVDLALDDRQPLVRCELRLDRPGVKDAICLDAWTLDRQPLATVEHSMVDRGSVSGAPHQSIKRINLADQMPLAQPADRGVARHRPDPVAAMRQQRGARAPTGRRCGSLGAGMAAANHDYVKVLFHVKHHFPMQKRANSASSIVSVASAPTMPANCCIA